MLDKNDKEWITETIDKKLNEATTELRDEMQEMKTELRDEMQEMETDLRNEMQEMKTDLRNEIQEMKTEIITDMTAVFENTYEDYIKIIRENVPDITRSYDTVEEIQFQQQGDINTLKSIAVDHGDRIAKLEKVLV